MAANGCIINLVRSKRRQVVAALILAGLALAAGVLLFLPGGKAPSPDARLLEAARGLTEYDVTLKLLPQSREVSLTETVRFHNDTGDELDHLVLRTWLNAFQSEETSPAATEEMYDACYPEGFSPGKLTVHEVFWNDQRISARYLDDAQTALRVEIPALAPGEEGTLMLRGVALIPICAHRTGVVDGRYQLGNVIPQLPLYQEHAWRTDAYAPVGDPFVSPCANFSVHVSLPAGYVPACSAPLTRGEDGLWHGSILAARDIALCVSEAYRTAEAWAGGTRITAYAATAKEASRGAEYARRAIETLSSLYGEFPYPSLSVCSVDFPFGGMEYSGLVMIGRENFLEDKRDTLELTVAHEVAHQWFYSMVGSDSVFAPWQDEALCQWAMLRYAGKRYGRGSYETLKFYQVDAPMAENIPGALTPGSPIDYFSSLTDYSAVVYGRGAALLVALEEMLPQGADRFLRAYVQEFAFRFAAREDFEGFLNRYAGMDCSPLLLDYLDTAH